MSNTSQSTKKEEKIVTVKAANWVDDLVGPKGDKGTKPPPGFKSKFEIPIMPLPNLAEGNPEDHEGNWCWRHWDNTAHSYRNEESLEAVEFNREPVTTENPLRVDCYDSIRSPYSYLVVPRLAWLRSNYNVEVNLHVIFPIAIRTPGLGGSKQTVGDHAHAPKKGGRWYWIGNAVNDFILCGEFQGVPI